MTRKEVAVRVSEQLGRDFAEIARRRRISKSALLVEALTEYIGRKSELIERSKLTRRDPGSGQ